MTEFVNFGGTPLPEMTKVIAAMGMLPSTTPTNVKMCLKDVETLEKFKDTLMENIQFLKDFGGLKSPGAHIVEDPLGPARSPWTSKTHHLGLQIAQARHREASGGPPPN